MTGGENEISILAELTQHEIAVVSLIGSNILTYSPHTSPKEGCPRMRVYILYTGQHYDALLGAEGQSIFEIHDEDDVAKQNAAALQTAKEINSKIYASLRER